MVYRFFNPHYSINIIISAIKNSYDFQLWLLESDITHPTVLTLKKNKDTGDLNTDTPTEGDNEKNENIIDKTDILDSNPYNDAISKNMTGLQKLVSLLHVSTHYNENKARTNLEKKNGTSKNKNKSTFSHENGNFDKSLDELQRKVLYAVSSGIRGNTDIQESLLKITKTEVYPVFNYNWGVVDDDHESQKHDSNKDNNDDGMRPIFLNYLNATSIITSTRDIVSYEVERKIWTIIADMIEEAIYIRGMYVCMYVCICI
jgi:hypothetical protein